MLKQRSLFAITDHNFFTIFARHTLFAPNNAKFNVTYIQLKNLIRLIIMVEL